MSINRRGFLGALVAPFVAKAGQRFTRFAKQAVSEPPIGMRVGVVKVGDVYHVRQPARFMEISGVIVPVVEMTVRIQS